MGANDRISIVAASDNNYAILLAALIKSIEVNHKTPEKIDLYVIDDGISGLNRKMINSIPDPNMISIHWHKMKDVVQGVNLPIDSSAFPQTAYLRIFSPYVVPENLEKIIYLDVDTIVQQDISTLWRTDLGDKLFGAVLDVQETVSCSWAGIPNYKELGIPADTKYFNSGLLVINTIEWRKLDVTSRVIKCLHDNIIHVNYADQYGLNAVLFNQWFELDPRWNWFAFKEAENPFIIHFLDIKPIFTTYASYPPFKDEFFKYLRLTPFKNFRPIGHYGRMRVKVYNKLKKYALKMFAK